MNWVKWVFFGLQLANQILPMILQKEEELGPKTGDIKKRTVISGATMAASLAGANNEQLEAIAKTTASTIDATVEALNTAKILKKSSE